jgi:hypothetical protein
VLVFDVRDTTEGRDAWYGKWVGAIRPVLEWQTARMDGEGRRDGD